MNRVLPLLALLALASLLAGCSGDDKQSETSTTTTTTSAAGEQTLPLSVYFLRDGKLQPVHRALKGATNAAARGALQELIRGPGERERSGLGLTSAVPAGTKVTELSLDGITTVRLNRPLDERARAQLVYTLTQFPRVRRVMFSDGGRAWGRSDFEKETPAVLIELPLPYQRAPNPLHMFGTANTSKGTFDYELVDSDGKVLTKDVVTASSGKGARGTFELTRSFKTDGGGQGKLVVFERSADDGSRINVVEIPVQL
jgi:Immunoglobulin-like domain of bacterial spore germination/Sporulation and spore germination